jgi:hypothetical protein
MSLEERACVLVSRAVGEKAVDREQAARVRVGDEHRTARRVQQDRVHGLGAEPDDRQHLPAQGDEGRAAHAAEAAAEPLDQPAREGLESPRLQPIRPRRANHLRQLLFGERGQALGTQKPASPQRGHRASGARPRGVLGQDGAHRDLVRSARRPPALRPEAARERDVEPQQPRFRGIYRRPRDLAPTEHACVR